MLQPIETLTKRELQVLAMAVAGATNPAIAGSLCIQPDTAKKHLSSVYKKLAVSGRRKPWPSTFAGKLSKRRLNEMIVGIYLH